MIGFKFTVCQNLIIRSVSTLQGDSGALSAAGVVGQSYQQIFPIYLEGGDDAVQTVLRENCPLFLRGHQTTCFCGKIQADISINPLHEFSGTVIGAEIILKSSSGCGQSGSVSKERQLIEIGKSSAALAHGVRNPLNAIKGAVVYLKDTYGKEATLVEFAEIIEEEISKLDGFVTRFLSTSLLESKFATLDVNEMLHRILSVSKFQAYEKKVSFVTEFDPIPLVMADVFQLEHAVMNVVTNALEAMAEGGEIRVKTDTARREHCEFVSISISDSGGGMVQEVSCETPDSRDGREPEMGRGFGLFLTREIVQLHNGLFEIVSRKNLGTSVAIYLPVESI